MQAIAREVPMARDDKLLPNDELLTAQETCAFIGGQAKPIDPATLYRGIKIGIYHQPVHPSPGISRWVKRRLAQDLARIIEGASDR